MVQSTPPSKKRGRPPTRKKGAYTPAEKMRRYRQRLKRSRPDPKTVAKQQRRAEREVALASATLRAGEVLGSRLYGVIYMDPATRFAVWSRATGLDRAADNHYPTELWDSITARPLPAAQDCVLLCWSTRAQLANTIRMIEDRWGFVYKTSFGWDKDARGTGYIAIDNFELLLVFSRGAPVWPAPGTQDLALIRAPRGRHSEKPEVFAEMIERLWPNTAKLEMFARQARTGWDCWGNEVAEATPVAMEPQADSAEPLG
jgi:N6-adenosine-specific RNA methylase IME4